MSVERRAMLTKEMRFEGGMTLKHGTLIYVQETPHGPLGSYYPNPEQASVHCFALNREDYSILVHGDLREEDLVVIPDEPEDLEELRRVAIKEAERRRDGLRHRLEKAEEELLQLRELE